MHFFEIFENFLKLLSQFLGTFWLVNYIRQKLAIVCLYEYG